MFFRHVTGAAALSVVLGCGPDPMDSGTASSGETGGETGSSGTGAETDTPTGGSGSSGEPEGSAFEQNDAEYEACQPSLCINLECGDDDVTSKYAAMIMAEIEDAGVASSIRFTHMSSYPDTDQILFHLEAQVAWYRYWTPGSIDTSDPDDEVRADLRQDIEELAADMPTEIVELSEVISKASACSGMMYTLCSGNITPTRIRILRETGDPCAGGSTDEFSIDIRTGESTCTLDAPTSCGSPAGR